MNVLIKVKVNGDEMKNVKGENQPRT